jgi:hypothetical protein
MFADAVNGVTEKQLSAVFDHVKVTCEIGRHDLTFWVYLSHRGVRYGHTERIPVQLSRDPEFYTHGMRHRFAAAICRGVTTRIMEQAL